MSDNHSGLIVEKKISIGALSIGVPGRDIDGIIDRQSKYLWQTYWLFTR